MTIDLNGPDALLLILSRFADPLCCFVEVEDGRTEEKQHIRYDISGTREKRPWFCVSVVYFPTTRMIGVWTREKISRNIKPGGVEPICLFETDTFASWLEAEVLNIVLEELTRP